MKGQTEDIQWLINVLELGPGKTAIIGNNRLAFFTIHLTAITLITASLIASIVVILKIHTKWKTASSKIDFPIRFPLYLAVADVLWGLSHLTDHMYLVTMQTYPTSVVLTQFLGTSMGFFFGYQQFMQASIAVYMYLRVVHNRRLNLGLWEWKLHFFWSVLLAITFGNSCFQGSLGNAGYWMAYDPRIVNGIVLAFGAVIASTTNAFFTTLGYYGIRRKVETMKNKLQEHKTQTTTSKLNETSNGVSDKRGRGQQSVVSQCLTTYVWVAACLYCPLAIALWINVSLSAFLRVVDPFTTLLIAVIANSSGSVNAYAFFYNERLKRERG